MRFQDRYTTEKLKEQFVEEEKDKLVLTDAEYMHGEMFQGIIDTLNFRLKHNG